MLYRSKPTEIEAVQWTGRNGNDLRRFVGANVTRVKPGDHDLLLLAGKDGSQGWVPVPVGHWIVRRPGDLTDHWPVDPDYFAAKYEPVNVATPPPAIPPDGRHTVECICGGRGIIPGPVVGSAKKCPGPRSRR